MAEVSETKQNVMRSLRLAKVAVNISVGKSGEPLEKAVKVLEKITEQKPCPRKAIKTIKDFGIRMGEPIACMTTLRGEKADKFLKTALTTIGNKLHKSHFDEAGNFAFGIREHIEIPGAKYDPELGIFGMDVAVSLERPGFRVNRRVPQKSKVGRSHLISREEAVQFIKEKFGTQIVE